VVTFAGVRFRKEEFLMNVTAKAVTLRNEGTRQAPVTVKLERVTSDYGRPCPPDGNGKEWFQRLKQSLGTASTDFVEASLHQLVMAARLPGSGGISETAVNAALAFIEGARPRDEVEAALVMQMACCHSAGMAVLRRLGSAHHGDRSVAAMASAAARLMRAYATQVEALRRLRNGGSQVIRIEHVHVSEGGQAVIGNIGTRE
jgi:hypothetical protein